MYERWQNKFDFARATQGDGSVVQYQKGSDPTRFMSNNAKRTQRDGSFVQ